MARPRIYNISLTDDELTKLKAIIRRKNTSRTIKCRCQILIDLDEAHGDVPCTCSIFAFVEPLGGRHHTGVHEHRTALDWAEEIKYLVDVMYPDAERIILVMDNLNTHKPASLYKKYPPEEARRIIKKLEIHYTPKHGSWLDMAEIELNVLTRQCLSRRIRTGSLRP